MSDKVLVVLDNTPLFRGLQGLHGPQCRMHFGTLLEEIGKTLGFTEFTPVAYQMALEDAGKTNSMVKALTKSGYATTSYRNAPDQPLFQHLKEEFANDMDVHDPDIVVLLTCYASLDALIDVIEKDYSHVETVIFTVPGGANQERDFFKQESPVQVKYLPSNIVFTERPLVKYE